jgi:hypothetical protein
VSEDNSVSRLLIVVTVAAVEDMGRMASPPDLLVVYNAMLGWKRGRDKMEGTV